jgi:DNA primase
MREQVLAIVERHLRGPFRRSGGPNVLTKCPFHKGGQERHESFSINLETGVYHCFTGGCGAAGNLKRLLRELGVSRTQVDAELRNVLPFLERQRRQFSFQKNHQFVQRDPFETEFTLPEALLGVYDWCPNLLVEKGFRVETLQSFDVGFDRVHERITYPLRDMYGNLAGISGGAARPGMEPKYHVYQGGYRHPITQQWVPGDFGLWFDEEFPHYKCENHDYIWNFDRVHARITNMSGGPATLYVVEGFKACMWMVQAGFENTVALMGSYISDRQQTMLHLLGVNVVLCLDNDEAGRKATIQIGTLLYRPMYGRVFVMQYPEIDDETQPDDYLPEELFQMAGAQAKHLKQHQQDTFEKDLYLKDWYTEWHRRWVKKQNYLKRSRRQHHVRNE